jgi:hypothetical protein
MGLWPLSALAPCLSYHPWGGMAYPYNPYLVTPPRIYDEAIRSISDFFYEPGNDILVAFMQFDINAWPGWAAYRYKFNADTGAFIERQAASIYTMAWHNHAGVGSCNTIFTTMRSSTTIHQVPWDTLTPQAGMWQADPHTWNPASTYNFALVNLIDGILAGVSSWNLDLWNLNPTPRLRLSMRLPDTLGYLAYEDRNNLWLITHGGLVAKANYRLGRWEMLSTVQNPSPDAINYLCAFDTRRKRLAVFRQRPDAADGACQCQIEFYRPLCRVGLLTDPVPVSPLRAGEKVRLVAHLVGDSGEGIGGYLVNAELLDPAQGECLTPVAGTELCGAVTFRYRAPAAGTDTLKISATVTDGD